MKKSQIIPVAETTGIDVSELICEQTNYFGEALKEVRIENRLSQHELSKRLGFTQSQLSFYENGKNKPTVDTMILMAKALGTSPFDLLRRAMSKSKYLKDEFQINSEMSKAIVEDAIRDYKKKVLADKLCEVC